MYGLDSGFPARVKAILGPTNTGKTHLAIERMLGHASGIIGFPLRLLARENYDRMVARKGPRSVALITGEEKIIPPDAKWFSCTVEAMPLDRDVEFVAVDEIQLCADPDRGHVFTDRLLHARGMVETMFLGAETIRPLMSRLVPNVFIETRPRLSRLTYSGPAKLARLPPRSAVVAFSAADVYALAHLIRRRKGGCAVVMGRLSPRTRNAQVALYQQGEVDFLVATDAIGMGLNMDVDHVAFASLGKFDGHRRRRLTASEVAQIAGRAGRGMRDGTFGTTTECQPLSDDVVEAVENHNFDALEVLCWRNDNLDFAGIDRLLESLAAAPPRAGLVKGADASDLETLTALSRDPDIRALARGRNSVRLLWEACQIPDFRKLADETHTLLCARVFGHLVKEGQLPTDWLASQIAALNRIEGDIDTLMQRLSNVRIWAYIAARADWVRDSLYWQGKAREVEDRLSDVLHELLTARFVDRRSAQLTRRLVSSDGGALLSAVTQKGEVVVEGHRMGRLEGFRFVPDPIAEGDEKLVMKATRRALLEEMPRRVAAVEAASDTSLGFTSDHLLTWDGEPIARLTHGDTMSRPRVRVPDSDFLDGVQRERLRIRLQHFVDGQIRADLAPLFTATEAALADPQLRGPLHRLGETLGLIPGMDDETSAPAIRPKLRKIGVRSGTLALFVPAMLKPRMAAMRARLWALARGLSVPDLPAASVVSMPVRHDWPGGFAATMGWVEAGPVLLRLDIAERIAGELGYLTRRGQIVLPRELGSRLSVRAELLPVILRRLGFRIVPGGGLSPEMLGPPAPPMLAPIRRRRSPRPVQGPKIIEAGGPFAGLSALKR
jgi:ATP-dependent RNA helicase SUPV3L1/SUV3